jgi:hypothetical protein
MIMRVDFRFDRFRAQTVLACGARKGPGQPPYRNGPVHLRRGFALRVLLAATLVLLPACRPGPGEQCQGPKPVRGAVGSETEAFFRSKPVQEVFLAHCMKLEVDAFGSRRIARIDLDKYNFVFPSSAPTADRIQEKINPSTPEARYEPFFSPMAIATFNCVAERLATLGVARKDQARGLWFFDVERYLQLAGRLRWEEIPGGTCHSPDRRSMYVSTTDPRESNSGQMYVGVLSYALNGREVVHTKESQRAAVSRLTDLFLIQGDMPDTSERLFEDYTGSGISEGAMFFVYEAQFLSRKVKKTGDLTNEMVLMYPTLTTDSEHTLVPRDPLGEEVGKLLQNDPDLTQLAAEAGFRTHEIATFQKVMSDNKIPVVAPGELENAPLPSYEVIESILAGIDEEYKKRS